MKFYLDSEKIDKIDMTDLNLNGILDINGKQTKNTEYAINYIGFDNSVV